MFFFIVIEYKTLFLAYLVINHMSELILESTIFSYITIEVKEKEVMFIRIPSISIVCEPRGD